MVLQDMQSYVLIMLFILSYLAKPISPDINECNGNHSCNETLSSCTNTDGSYSCHCVEGYTQESSLVCIGKK